MEGGEKSMDEGEKLWAGYGWLPPSFSLPQMLPGPDGVKGQLQNLYTIAILNLFQLFVLSDTAVYQAALCYKILFVVELLHSIIYIV